MRIREGGGGYHFIFLPYLFTYIIICLLSISQQIYRFYLISFHLFYEMIYDIAFIFHYSLVTFCMFEVIQRILKAEFSRLNGSNH